MVKRLFFLLILTCSSLSQAQTLSAFVDRTDISFNDIFNLTLRVDAELGNATPSFTGLDRNFEQLGLSRTNTYTNNNGNIQSWNEYRVSLKPKATGSLTIPSFRVGGQLTVPITINVADAPQTANSGNEEIFIDTFVSKENIYVQEQLLYTIKLYYTLSFDPGAQLTSPQVDNSVVQQLGSDATYQEIIDGIRYNVTERKFVVFPQSSGELIIPPVYFTATVGRRGGLSRILSNRANVREISLSSDAKIIDVMPKPANFPGQDWLPSSNFSIEESWSGPLDGLSIGESITRNIIVSAAGLSSSLLSDLTYPTIDNLKFYPDQPVREDLTDTEGVTGRRLEGAAIVPSTAGEFIIPAIEIPWWNTNTDSLEIALIPARTLNVLPGTASSEPAQIQPGLNSLANQSPRFSNNTENPSVSSQLYLYWIIATVLFAAAWLFSTVMWLRNKQMLALVATTEFLPQPSGNSLKPARNISSNNTTKLPDVKTAYRVLEKACEQKNLPYIKRALTSWGQAYFQNRQIITLDNFNHYAQSPALANILLELEKNLYSEESEQKGFSASKLLNEVNTLQKSGKNESSKSQHDYDLPPLYKN